MQRKVDASHKFIMGEVHGTFTFRSVQKRPHLNPSNCSKKLNLLTFLFLGNTSRRQPAKYYEAAFDCTPASFAFPPVLLPPARMNNKFTALENNEVLTVARSISNSADNAFSQHIVGERKLYPVIQCFQNKKSSKRFLKVRQNVLCLNQSFYNIFKFSKFCANNNERKVRTCRFHMKSVLAVISTCWPCKNTAATNISKMIGVMIFRGTSHATRVSLKKQKKYIVPDTFLSMIFNLLFWARRKEFRNKRQLWICFDQTDVKTRLSQRLYCHKMWYFFADTIFLYHGGCVRDLVAAPCQN